MGSFVRHVVCRDVSHDSSDAHTVWRKPLIYFHFVFTMTIFMFQASPMLEVVHKTTNIPKLIIQQRCQRLAPCNVMKWVARQSKVCLVCCYTFYSSSNLPTMKRVASLLYRSPASFNLTFFPKILYRVFRKRINTTWEGRGTASPRSPRFDQYIWHFPPKSN